MKKIKLLLFASFFSISIISIAQEEVNVGDTTSLEEMKAIEVYNTGIEKFNEKDYATAILFFDSAIVLSPNYEKAYYDRGTAKYQLKD